jgi:hypothetical protein
MAGMPAAANRALKTYPVDRTCAIGSPMIG